MKLLHAADLHIDSPMKGIERYEGAPVDLMRASTRQAVENLVALAIRERVDVVTIGGDVFDGDWHEVKSGLWWNGQLDQLTSSGIEVYVVHGNHDAETQLTHRLPVPPGVHVFGADRPQTLCSNHHPLAVHGQSYRDRVVSEDLAAGFPPAVPGLINVGLLHTSLDGRPGHANYAPCQVEVLRAKHYDLWALGHVHQREEAVHGATHVLFPGNTQGRNARETGAKGVSLIQTDGDRVLDIAHIPIDAARWDEVKIDIAALASLDDAVEAGVSAATAARARAGRPLAVRIVLTGTGEVRRKLQERLETLRLSIITRLTTAERDVWVEKLVDQTRPPRATGAAESEAVEAIQRLLARALDDEALAAKLADKLANLDTKLKATLPRLGSDTPSRLDSVKLVRERLPQAADLLTAMLEAQ